MTYMICVHYLFTAITNRWYIPAICADIVKTMQNQSINHQTPYHRLREARNFIDNRKCRSWFSMTLESSDSGRKSKCKEHQVQGTLKMTGTCPVLPICGSNGINFLHQLLSLRVEFGTLTRIQFSNHLCRKPFVCPAFRSSWDDPNDLNLIEFVICLLICKMALFWTQLMSMVFASIINHCFWFLRPVVGKN